jgi:predicted peptidase
MNPTGNFSQRSKQLPCASKAWSRILWRPSRWARACRALALGSTLLLVGGLSACKSAPVSSAAAPLTSLELQSVQSFQAGPSLVRFQLQLPQEYGRDPKRLWPTILFLHGAGERGDQIEKVKVHGPPKIAASDADFPFIVVSPQCPNNASWSDDSLNLLLDHVLANWAVDPDRVYLTGLSMGGFGAWSLAQESPQRFAAVVPICGGGTAIRAWLYGDSEKGRALRRLPFWAFHGAKDTVVPPAESQRMVDALRGVGCEVRLTIDPEAGHDSWTKAYADPELYAWMLTAVRGADQGSLR